MEFWISVGACVIGNIITLLFVSVFLAVKEDNDG